MKIKTYKLSLDVDFYGLSFIGHETISVVDPESSLALDAAGLEVKSVDVGGSTIQFEQDPDAKKLKINGLPQLKDARHDATIKIDIEYQGKVAREALYGFYKSRYDSSDYFVTTDFEPNGARWLFPCVDNPSYKAEFELYVTTQKDLSVISNTKAQTVVEVDGGRVRHVFEKTPKMPTYLFYLGIGKFDISRLKDGNVEFRASARPGYSTKGRFALENAVKFLRIYEDYYSIRYPLDKLDLIALPEYSAGAMENWGAITFREVALLIDENSSAANKRTVTSVLGHEIAHQWFGDLVTMAWWNDLWLNESFATFMESKMTNKLYPEWNVWSDFLQDMTAGSMIGDSLASTHPIDEKVSAPEEISEIFDEISYGKGASVLRMIESWIGEDPFMIGVREYLAKFKYSNAKGDDLWQKLEQASGKPVSEVMGAWIKKPGYPVVSVSLEENGKLQFSQNKFVLRRKSEAAGTYEDVWPVPIVLQINGATRSLLLRDRSSKIPVTGELDQIKVNSGQTGFYRVLYDKELYSMVEKSFEKMDAFDRWGIIGDLFAFLMANQVEPKVYFDFARKALNETDYLVVDSVTSQLEFLRTVSPRNETLKSIYLDFHRAHISRLGLESRKDEKDTDRILRGKIAAGLATEDRRFAEEILRKFPDYEKVEPDLRTAAAIALALTKGEEAFGELVRTMKKIGSEADVVKIYRGLTSFKDPLLVQRTLDLSICGEISRADSLYAVIDATQNPYAREMTWNWVKSNLSTFRELFRGTPNVSFMLQGVISLAGMGREKEVEDYFSTMRIEEAEKGIRKGLELLAINSDLRRRLAAAAPERRILT